MSKPAARIGDMHVCPMVSPGPVPHVGGPIIGPGVPTVLIGGVPAAVLGDMCTCVGPPDTIALGSTGVFIGGKPAARMGDTCVHGGAITVGCPTVMIGEIKPDGSAATTSVANNVMLQFAAFDGGSEGTSVSQQIQTMTQAGANGNAFCELCDKEEEEVLAEKEKRPVITNLQWVKENRMVTASRVKREITLRAYVKDIDDGETITFTIDRPAAITLDGSPGEVKGLVELTGTVEKGKVEVVWEVEDPLEGSGS